MTSTRVLVAGIGNIFLGDDGFGVAVAQRLQARPLPEGVEVIDFGIRGLDLAYALQECDAAILIDTVSRGGAPGTLYLLEPDPGSEDAGADMHSMTPARVLSWIATVGRPVMLRIVGCEPASFGAEGMGRDGLSDAVSSSVDEAAHMVEAIIDDILSRDALYA